MITKELVASQDPNEDRFVREFADATPLGKGHMYIYSLSLCIYIYIYTYTYVYITKSTSLSLSIYIYVHIHRTCCSCTYLSLPGQFATVFRATSRLDKQSYAVKVVRRSTAGGDKDVTEQTNQQRDRQHP